MFKFLQSLLSQKTTKPKTQHTVDNTCSIEIQMNTDGTINILCSWPEFDDINKEKIIAIANNYALMIDALNNGYLSKEILQTIKNFKSENAYDTLFAQNVLYKIGELLYVKEKSNSKLDDYPLIRPTQAFKSLYTN